jgi:Zn-dependent peptidase ImmA (M78 family)
MARRRRRVIAKANPKIMTWAIQTSGWKIEELADKLKIKGPELLDWMSDQASPSVRQLEELADALKRPMAIFFLSELPKEMPLPKDYRLLPNKTDEFDKETLLAIRRARRQQRAAKGLLQGQNDSSRPDVNHESLLANPLEIAFIERQWLGISNERQRGWSSAYEAFRTLRESIESRNIFVFQMRMPIDDTRGFVLVDEDPAVIVINSSDSIEARVFTLVHEYGHVLINKSGINTPEISLVADEADEVEIWCNEFASEFLVPKALVIPDFKNHQEELLQDETITSLSRKWKVSKSMIITKMLKNGFIDTWHYNNLINELKTRGIPETDGGFGTTVEERVLREKGRKFVKLVSKNVERGAINYNDAIDYLSIKLGDFDKVANRAEQ